MARKLPFTFEQFKNIYSQVPRLAVDLIIKNDKELLLTLRTKNGYVNTWHLPGGTVHYQEAVADAAKRVAKDELGIEINNLKFLGYIEYLDEEKYRGFGHTVSLVFLCHPISQKLTLDDQAAKAEYFKKLPENIITQQKEFILAKDLI